MLVLGDRIVEEISHWRMMGRGTHRKQWGGWRCWGTGTRKGGHRIGDELGTPDCHGGIVGWGIGGSGGGVRGSEGQE